ncbi:acyclic terpene utilization AtuA family protein [Propylenella binzhouense]|uniref:DUF1446 domain-containing protein n=1 Tax=Propylenella binzhouense TaxID=2555902 RepID=A0A964T4C2_9HYPH|nr:acyclic terpene utilization AtuA family protein [Propylenella binzhouense]MYZ47292.1 DUF1446 domain-containing protein [Propylenella binzhouense]
MKSIDAVRIGVGAGFSDDRLTPALDLVSRVDLDYLVLECLAERTIARENLSRAKDPDKGYTPSLHERLQMLLPTCMEKNIRIVTNMGAANPLGAARAARDEATNLGLGSVPVAVVLGDDVTELVRSNPGLELLEDHLPVESLMDRIVSANAYLGADVICEALRTRAPIVITGRVADPSLFLAPLMHEFGWTSDNQTLMGQGTMAGHLLECSVSVAGGYFGWPGKKDVPNLADSAFPYADVGRDGSLFISKTPGTGGLVSVQTCSEQLIYEVHDPQNYITPDCVMDITGVDLIQAGENRVQARGAIGKPATDSYKVTVGYTDGYIGEGEVSYGGIGALDRARWAAEIVKERLRKQNFVYDDFRVDFIGMSSLHGKLDERVEPYEVRLRLAGRTQNRRAAQAVGFETRAMHIHGPGGGGGGSDPKVRDVLAVKSVLIPKHLVRTQVVLEN